MLHPHTSHPHIQIPASKSPVPSEREDVNKLVSDLIGGTLSPFSSQSPQKGNSKSPEPIPGGVDEVETGKATPPFPRKRHVKLVMDHLAPINIRPKVRHMMCVMLVFRITPQHFGQRRSQAGHFRCIVEIHLSELHLSELHLSESPNNDIHKYFAVH